MKRSYKTRSKKITKNKLYIFFALVLAIMLFVFWFLNDSVRPAMLALSSARVTSVVNRAMLEAIYATMSEREAYSSLVSTQIIGQKLSMLKADTVNMNLLASECTAKAAKAIAELGDYGISIAIGSLTNVPMFSGLGPKLKMEFTPAGSVLSEFHSAFSSSGINQTLFRVSLKLNANVHIIMPGANQSIDVSCEAIIAECVIVGDVPQVFTDVTDDEDMLNLIPTELP